MAEKRRGLGRGLGALIPTGPATTGPASGQATTGRPVDVFFPGSTADDALEDDRAQERVSADAELRQAAVALQAMPRMRVPAGGRAARADAAERRAAERPRAAATRGEAGSAAPLQPDAVEPSAPGPDALEPETADPKAVRTDPEVPEAAVDGDVDPLADSAPLEGLTDVDTDVVAGQDSAGADAGTATDTEHDTAGAADHAVAPVDPGTEAGLLPVPGAHFAELPVGDIRPNPRQPRTVFDEEALAELVGSIKEIGVLQPVVVRPSTSPDGPPYELIMGERRWRATQEAGLATIPAIVRETEDHDLLRDALLENLHRSQLNPLEEAAAYEQLLGDFGCTHEELAQRIHRSRPQISNTLRLLRLPPLVQRRVAAGVLSAGHARALLGLPDAAAMERMAQRIVAEGLSVRATEEIVTLGGLPERGAPVRRSRPGGRNAALEDLATRLSDRFETRVKIALGRTKGRLTVEFASVEDLNRILTTISPDDPGVLR